jgi:galactokinase
MTPPPADILAQTETRFAEMFGRPAQWIAAAPGRVNLIGEHTDYNGGFVLPMAISRRTVIAAAPNGSDAIRLHSSLANAPATLQLAQPFQPGPRGDWTNYVAGVAAGFQARGARLTGFDAVVGSDVPLGGGLSSSAALEVATATLLEAVTGLTIDPVEKALLCQRAEHDFAGVPCGIMDQFVSALARKDHLLLLDCRSQQTEHVPLADPAVTVLIINTQVRHELAGGEYAERRRQCEAAAGVLGVPSLREATAERLEAARGRMDATVHRRARHVVGEIERTLRAAAGMRAGDWPAVGRLMYASHDSLRDDYEVSCAELDAVVAAAGGIGLAGGVYGCRMTGGGFGGCAVALVKTAAVAEITESIGAEYERRTGLKPALFASRPAAGAGLAKGGLRL